METTLTLTPAQQPTMYFLGVTTGGSSIKAIFPRWTSELGLEDARLVGLDFKIKDDPARYRAAVEHIKRDPLSCGALVTTHKLDVVDAAGDLFDGLDPFAQAMSEVSCIYKRGGKLYGAAKDADTSALAMNTLVPRDHWENTRAEALFLGAGGATAACAWMLADGQRGDKRPVRIHITDIDPARLQHVESVYQKIQNPVPLETHRVHADDPADELVGALPPGSLVVNATGMGKDRPGSPVSDAVPWPERGLVWELNYRGERRFLQQAQNQAEARGLTVEDGWTYFLYGWTQVMADVFNITIPTKGPVFEKLSRLAAGSR